MPPITRNQNKKTQKERKKPYTNPIQSQKNTHSKENSYANKLTEKHVDQGQMTMKDDDLDRMMEMVNEIECEDTYAPPIKDEDLNTVLEMVDEIECDKSQESSIRDDTPKHSSKNGDDTIRIITNSSSPQSTSVQNKPFQLIGPSHISQEMLKMARSYWESIPQMTQTTIHFMNTLFSEANNTIL